VRVVAGGRLTHVKTVVLTSQDGARVIYAVTLACGCRFWEHRLSTALAPEIGRQDRCFASHSDELIDLDGVI
jgi:hypothetical protein